MEEPNKSKPESKLHSQLKKATDWIKPYWKKLLSYSRAKLILFTAIIEIGIIYFLFQFFGSTFAQEPWLTFLKGNGVWTFIILLISAPIAFLVWKFRDENTVHQLENQRKDVNLKEFQKIAEWVSGLHLVEDKLVEKTKKIEKSTENNPSEQGGNQEKKTDTTLETEISREYGQSRKSQHIPSHSRQDGAVGLQVAAVYMLKPFYCGEHGDGFRKPALNLLTSAWLALFKQVEDSKENNQKLDSEKLKNSPLAIALTQVLLADGGIHLRYHPEVFSNLYLPYLNFHLPGLDKEKVLKLFSEGLDCSGINLEHAELIWANLEGAKLDCANLEGAELDWANLNGANLYLAQLCNIEIDTNPSCHGVAFDTENIQQIRPYLDKQSLIWIIQVPKVAEQKMCRLFRFEREEFVYIHRLPNSLTVEELQKLNPTWQVSLVEN
ncbi:MAG: pentapeptide repeat-containing protein [Neisseria zoodegmatis]|uniref:pentapeptide repeat-containing protein n=1 Tax=Neisseria zoodegmatis TaxID=326523 RepID=UPI0026EC82EC|nr:pentapeptide repeat-containing protein [Neisseria zoodegmatis]MDO5068815.1 pentapeptide repeat-containing protein [Neisseria zoodegmatis]